MKRYFTIIAIFCTLNLLAQEPRLLKQAQGQVELTEVVILDSFPAAQLYFNSTQFLAEAFHGVRETAQLKDPKAKSVATKGSFPVLLKNSYGDEIKGKVVFTLLIQSKENMYKYTFNDLYFAYTEETGITSYASFDDRRGIAMSVSQWQEVERQANEFIQEFVADLKAQMSQTTILCKEAIAALRKKEKGK